MTPDDISGYIENLKERFSELETKLSDPAIYANASESKKIFQEHRKLGRLFQNYDRWKSFLREIEENQLMLDEDDAEIREMAASEIEALNGKILKLEAEVKLSL
ncbi:MAG: PCRF domain-containing protein, partial [Victivallaceae bacterium]